MDEKIAEVLGEKQMVNKIKLLICSHALEIGGAERSLLDLMYSFDYSKVSVDLFLYRHEGDWISELPEEVNLLPEIPEYACLAVPVKTVLRKKCFSVLAGRAYGRSKARHYERKRRLANSGVAIEYSHKYTRCFMPQIQPEVRYDLAISFLTPHYFVAEKVNAKRKIAWIHTDYSCVDIDVDSESLMWEKYDFIASISDSCTKGFVSKFPQLKNRIVLIENVLAEQLVRKKSAEKVNLEMDLEKKHLNLLSIGRYDHAKNFDQIPEICTLLLEKGLCIKWYIVGYGDSSEILNAIEKFKVSESVILLGKKANPYPYIRNCDVYIQPSRYEGKSVTVREAQMLNKPVIITNYPTACSQLVNGYDGFVVPLDTEACADGIAEILQHKEWLTEVAENTKKEDYSNKAVLEKIYEIAQK